MRLMIMAIACLLTGCAGNEEAREAAMEIAEATYPGQLEVHDIRLMDQFRHDVTFAIRGDPITRIRLSLGSDPAACLPGTECQAQLRESYRNAVIASSRLKALNRAFGGCGVTLLAFADMADAFVVELDLDAPDQQAALDRLHACTRRYWQEGGDARPLKFRILRPGSQGSTTMPALVTFETKLPDARLKEPTYLVTVSATDDRIARQTLRFDPQYLRSPPVRAEIKAAILPNLAARYPRAELPFYMDYEDTTLHPHDVDRIRTSVPACSQPAPANKGHCTQDLLVRLAYHLDTREVNELEIASLSR